MATKARRSEKAAHDRARAAERVGKKKEPAQAKAPATAAPLAAHFQRFDRKAETTKIRKDARLDENTILYAAEALPIGSVIEHEGLDRWRATVKEGGVHRYGHGKNLTEAVEALILGDRPPLAGAPLATAPAARPEPGTPAAATLEAARLPKGTNGGEPKPPATRRSAGSKKAKRSGKAK